MALVDKFNTITALSPVTYVQSGWHLCDRYLRKRWFWEVMMELNYYYFLIEYLCIFIRVCCVFLIRLYCFRAAPTIDISNCTHPTHNTIALPVCTLMKMLKAIKFTITCTSRYINTKISNKMACGIFWQSQGDAFTIVCQLAGGFASIWSFPTKQTNENHSENLQSSDDVDFIWLWHNHLEIRVLMASVEFHLLRVNYTIWI